MNFRQRLIVVACAILATALYIVGGQYFRNRASEPVTLSTAPVAEATAQRTRLPESEAEMCTALRRVNHAKSLHSYKERDC